jgi:S-adenosyl-L-homocysteine hydrolase, NAD binding domain/S-adenosyl-L-homocysteine hydrolase
VFTTTSGFTTSLPSHTDEVQNLGLSVGWLHNKTGNAVRLTAVRFSDPPAALGALRVYAVSYKDTYETGLISDAAWLVIISFAISRPGVYHLNRIRLDYTPQGQKGWQYQNINATVTVKNPPMPGPRPLPPSAVCGPPLADCANTTADRWPAPSPVRPVAGFLEGVASPGARKPFEIMKPISPGGRLLSHMTRMKHQAIVGNIGHFDNESDMAGLARLPGIKRTNVKPQVDEWTFPDGHAVIILSEGRPTPPASQLRDVQQLHQSGHRPGRAVHQDRSVPAGRTRAAQAPRRELARLHPGRARVRLTTLTKEQAAYIGVPVDGPFKPDHYRY